MTKTAKKKTAPKKLNYKRDENGLLESVEYKFKESGEVDWREMVGCKFLYVNQGWFTSRDKPAPSSPEGLKDNQLLIMIGGIKDVAKIRGYDKMELSVQENREGYVVAKCRIHWSPNFENPEGFIQEDYANATFENTDDFCVKFLETIACNRAFVRCVRNSLGINICGFDEIDKGGVSQAARPAVSNSDSSKPTGPVELLESILKQKGLAHDFESFKNVLRGYWTSEKYMNDNIKDWKDFSDIPISEAKKLITLIKKQ